MCFIQDERKNDRRVSEEGGSMSNYCYCGKCGSEMKSKGLARIEGLCQYCWDKWYRQEITWLGSLV